MKPASCPLSTSRSSLHKIRRRRPPLTLRVYRRAGHGMRVVLTDQRIDQRGALNPACRTAGIEHRPTQPRHARTNGFVERLQGTVLTESWRRVFRRSYFTRLERLERALARYLRFYTATGTWTPDPLHDSPDGAAADLHSLEGALRLGEVRLEAHAVRTQGHDFERCQALLHVPRAPASSRPQSRTEHQGNPPLRNRRSVEPDDDRRITEREGHLQKMLTPVREANLTDGSPAQRTSCRGSA